MAAEVNPQRSVQYLLPYHFDIICTLIYQELDMQCETLDMLGLQPSRLPEDWEYATQYLVDVSLKYSMTDKTKELSIILLRTYIIRKHRLDGKYPKGLYELALVALSIASKVRLLIYIKLVRGGQNIWLEEHNDRKCT